MYLKSIEVQGFKSFANKIVFDFENGITGIVGPNGSGKSNVADAVRWVLGEQRIKQLRGASMQDVIFSGTELRKPVGSAYVAITLDNSDHSLAIDYEEVTVARRIYRSGESEYLLNGTPCRLKDVNELFYDTGIGKEGYSIIGQGQIDLILSSKPEDRRELFDEAAGIVKFKRRKVEATKKLESERANLLRVNDILAELNNQIGPLEKQAEKAKVYLKRKEEQKKLDVNIFLLETEKLRTNLEESEKKRIIAQNDLDSANHRNETLKAEYEELQTTLETLEKEIEEARNSLAGFDVTREKLEGQISLLKEQIKSAEGNKEHMQSRIEAVDAQILAKEEEKNTIHLEKEGIDKDTLAKKLEKEKANEELISVQKQIETVNFSIEKSKSLIIELLSERGSIKAGAERLNTMTEQKNIQLSELNAKLLTVKSKEEEQSDIITSLEEEFKRVNDEVENKRFAQIKLEEEIDALRVELTSLDEKLREKQALYHQQKSKYDTISDLTVRYEGYSNTIKKVMEKKEEEKGIFGVVADIIKVDKKYEVAIETALGGNIQNIVTDDENTAKKMIQYLKDNRLGRATFLPLTTITHPQEFKNPECLTEKGVIGMACDLVTQEDKYKDVSRAMLGRIVVVDTVDNALKIAKKFDYGIRMVTIEGELLVPGGAISGGNFKNNSNLLSRRREMEELKSLVEKTAKEVEECDKAIADCKARRNQVRLENERMKLECQEGMLRLNTARISVNQAKEKMSDVTKDFDTIRKDIADIKTDLSAIENEKKEFDTKLQDNLSLESCENEKVKSEQVVLEELRENETEKLNIVSGLDLELSKLVQKQDFSNQNFTRVGEELSVLTKEKEELTENFITSGEEIENKKNDIIEIEKTIEASHSTQTETQISLAEKVKTKEELSTKQKEFFTEREKITDLISGLDKELFRLNTQKEKMEEALSYQTSYMWQEYEITLRDATELRDETMTDLPALKRQVNSVKDVIRKLGDVNVGAIEEYRNVSERHTFLTTQHDDLVEAEKTLVKIIEELDESMRKQFREQFGKIASEFDKVFKELFGGGKGSLELMDDEDILEAGIRIIAQPPGKKLQNMMQLSGGEKALTAISLLFAIQNLKPSPFCLLDEIEAALDESNVERFASYLNKMTKDTQFIVITHRRGTMRRTDRLYGITMQEKGVSALVSVDLIDDKLDN
ncbi:MAG: chromosome segregation protein SMC [Lachnospiraceae bacterium]|nr:chromosome segregation protein SMC [Lachnospiraceae bacterium]